jgi:hypothetical protein
LRYISTIQATICKQEDWSEEAFLSVDWAAHEYAFSRTWSCKRISYTKLTHKLLNTNVQNRKRYGKSDLCPCCVSTAETVANVFVCPSPCTTVFRLNQQEVLWNQLTLLAVILHRSPPATSLNQFPANPFVKEIF